MVRSEPSEDAPSDEPWHAGSAKVTIIRDTPSHTRIEVSFRSKVNLLAILRRYLDSTKGAGELSRGEDHARPGRRHVAMPPRSSQSSPRRNGNPRPRTATADDFRDSGNRGDRAS